MLDNLQRRTTDVQQIVQSNMKQRDEELKLREQEVFKALRAVEEELAIEVDIEEKKLDEEEQRLQRMKEEFSRMKANLAEELEKSDILHKKEY